MCIRDSFMEFRSLMLTGFRLIGPTPERFRDEILPSGRFHYSRGRRAWARGLRWLSIPYPENEIQEYAMEQVLAIVTRICAFLPVAAAMASQSSMLTITDGARSPLILPQDADEALAAIAQAQSMTGHASAETAALYLASAAEPSELQQLD